MDCIQYPRTSTTGLDPAVRVRLIALIEADTMPTGTGWEQHGPAAWDTLAAQLKPLLGAWSRQHRPDALAGRTALALLHWPSDPRDGSGGDDGPELVPLPAWAARELVPLDAESRSAAIGEGLSSGTPAVTAPPVLTEPLSARELEVLRLVAAGLSNREIAAALFLSVGTVKQHLHHINGKLGTKSRTSALARGRHFDLL
jgi:DNA-binding CsgD family transcriptional regulator